MLRNPDADVTMEVDAQGAPAEHDAHQGPLVRRASPAPPPPPAAHPRSPVGFVYDSRMMEHCCLSGHPEQPARIQVIFDAFMSLGLIGRMWPIPCREALRDEVLLVHSETLWDKVMAIASMNTQDIADSEAYYQDLSLYVHPSTSFCARLSCGGVIEATLAVARGIVKKSFAIVRPPGHHSEPDEHMGFCFFNNVAVAIKVMQQLTPFKKVLILDWDVHHGNGTQRAFYDDPSVLYVSLHRYEDGQYYPNGPFGSMVSCGVGAGLGYSVNVPWPDKGMGDADYLLAFQHVIMPIAMEFAPELVIISAGFDAAKGDELGECEVTPAGYAHMTHMLSGLANGRLVVALEGGYNLEAISVSATAVAKVVLGEAPPELPPMVASELATETVWQVAVQQSKYWKSVTPKACEPREELEEITWSIPELLKAHRQEYLFREHGMLEIPFLNAEMTERFSTQAACTHDVWTNKTLVVFVHEFGNLRVELESALTCDLHLEHSYMVDFSKQLVRWVQDSGYALLDMNVFPKPATAARQTRHRDAKDYSTDAMVYLWDNYIQLTNARKIILIGHGPGCHAVMELLSERTATVMRLVKAVVQVVGNYTIPMIPRDVNDLRVWYHQNSMVIIPNGHPIQTQKTVKRHGRVIASDETKPIFLLMRTFPIICSFVQKKLAVETNGTGTPV